MKTIVAHRGASAYAPENTLAAFEKARAMGAQWMECDAKLSLDGEVILFHDSRLNRTTNGKGWVRSKNYHQLLLLDAGSWFSPLYKDEKIPLLKDVLAYCNKVLLNMVIEIKPGCLQAKSTAKAVMKIIQSISPLNIQIFLSSFDRDALKQVRLLDKKIPLAMTIHQWNSNWKLLAEALDCSSVHCSERALTKERIEAIKQTGRSVFTYTVNNAHRAETLFEWGVDAIFSDYPDLLKD